MVHTTCFPNVGAYQPASPYDLDEPEERHSALDAMNPESLRAAKLGLIGAMAAETPRQFTIITLSALSPFLLTAIGESTSDLVRNFNSEGLLKALVELAESNGITGGPLDALKAKIAANRAARDVVYPAGPLPCCRPQIDPDGTLILALEQSQRQLADRDEVRVKLRGVNFADVKVTKSEAGYFVEAPAPTLGGGGPKALYRGAIHAGYLYGVIGRLGLPGEQKPADAVVSWDAATEELVLAFMRTGVTEVKVEVPDPGPAPTSRLSTLTRIVEIAMRGVVFEVPAGVNLADPTSLGAYLVTLDELALMNLFARAYAANVARDSAASTPATPSWEAPVVPPAAPAP